MKVLKCCRASSVVGTIDRDLLAVHGRDESRAQRHFGLAEADIAADEAIHRTSGFEIADHGIDRGLLIVGFLIGKAGAEFVENAGRDARASAPRAAAARPRP